VTEIIAGIVVFGLSVMTLSLTVLIVRTWVLPAHAVSVCVNSHRTLPARTGQTLLDILLDCGIPVPSACAGVGSCGLCRVVVTSGGGEALPVERARLAKKEIQGGIRLACQVVLRRDVGVSIPDDILGAETLECRVIAARTLSPLIREIVLEVPSDRHFDHRAGAFVQVTAPAYQLKLSSIEISPEHRVAWERLGLSRLVAHSPRSVTRAYSIANTPEDEGTIVLFVRLAVPPPRAADAPPGIVSSYLFGLKAGDTVKVSGPYGAFGATAGNREMVFIGGGVGMAPLRAIIFDQLERLGTRRKISYWYGARSRIDLFHIDDLEALARKHDNFSFTVALSDPAPNEDWSGVTGFIHSVVYERHLSTHPAPEDCDYFLCGPPLMIEAVRTMLDECGVDETSIFFDDFGS
jgi:Na+-transporting NADH:ubiquinone oxidoreductase subunit F